jgi:hypothetical protein
MAPSLKSWLRGSGPHQSLHQFLSSLIDGCQERGSGIIEVRMAESRAARWTIG